jgi:DNA-binding IclR family transcriptional regulator
MNKQALSAHVLHALAQAQVEGRRLTLETLTEALAVRRTDVRSVVTTLDRQGFVDALRMRPTLLGFALARSLPAGALPVLRPRPRLAVVAA